MNEQEILWQPSEAFIVDSNLKKFETWLKETRGLRFENYAALWAWSVQNVAEFWACIWEYFDIISHTPYTEVLSGDEMPHVKWFEGATLNYAEHIFRHKNDGQPALIFQEERQPAMEISWKTLEAQVYTLQQYLLAKGVTQGDRIAAYLPNIPEAIVAFLAVNSIGAIWSCCSPDFGVNTVIDRFSQIEPTFFIAADGYQYNGKSFDRLAEMGRIVEEIESIQEILLIPYLNEQAVFEKAVLWDDMLATESSPKAVEFTPVPFDHPIWVLYSSGTTGRPKAITHSHGGVLLEHLKYLAFHNDVHKGENFFWFTTTGWMMWNFLQASMLMGATPVLFDGSPGRPDLNALWSLSESLPIHHFGTSAPYLTACMKQGLTPSKQNDLSKLRSIGSTGAPLPAEAFDWVYASVSKDVWLCSMSGGTDICTAFVGGCPTEPVYKGAIQCRGLGCAMQAYSEEGTPITGRLGEMVVEEPMPSMPIYFWNDENHVRYLQSYFDHYPGKWRHGDWIQIFENGSLIIQGRSDATLNRKGIRIGTAEIYAVLDGIEGVEDGMVLNLEKAGGDDVMPLFIVLSPGRQLDEELTHLIQSSIRSQCSPRHVPDFIEQVADIPYTLSGKKMEVPVKKILLGMDVSKNMNKDAVRNPAAIEDFVKRAPAFREKHLGV